MWDSQISRRLSGIYVPVGEGHVESIECKWDDDRQIIPCMLEEGSVLDVIKQICDPQLQYHNNAAAVWPS